MLLEVRKLPVMRKKKEDIAMVAKMSNALSSDSLIIRFNQNFIN